MSNLASISKAMLVDAITKGYIHLPNGEIRELTTSQIVSIAKFCVQQNITLELSNSNSNSNSNSTEQTPIQLNIPLEMFNGSSSLTSLDTEESLIPNTPEDSITNIDSLFTTYKEN